MPSVKTIRTATLGKIGLRLAKQTIRFSGFAGGKIIAKGADVNDMWRRRRNEAVTGVIKSLERQFARAA
jgi:hypothetical protein